VSVTNNGPINEGASATVTIVATDPAGAADPLSYEFDCNNDSTYEVGPQSGNAASCAFNDNGSYVVSVRVSDGDGGVATGSTAVTVNNVAPTVGAITAPTAPVRVNTVINTSASFTDPGVLDTHTAAWDWGDGSTIAGVVSEANGSGSVNANHAYVTPGLYTVKLTVTDKDGGSTQSVFRYVVVYNPAAGFVTGGGWINSPAGAYLAKPTLTGKATFGFVTMYPRGANVPRGQTDFYLRVANLNLHSTSYQWLVIANAKAQFQGSGKINGKGNYGFLVTAMDSKVGGHDNDKFRIKIWDKATGNVIYDNQIGTPDDADATQVIGGGSIVIYK
jgi:PKD repeat protein